MYCVYDGLTGKRLSFEYSTRAEAEHVEKNMKHIRPNSITLNTKWELR